MATTPDEHLASLIKMAEVYEKAAAHFARCGIPSAPDNVRGLYERRAAAIRWLLAETAHGVDESEIVA